MKSVSVCTVCFQTYYLDGDEIYFPSNMKIRREKLKNPYIETWCDWIYHIQSHCPACRFECSESAKNDLEKHRSALSKEKFDMTKDNQNEDDEDWV